MGDLIHEVLRRERTREDRKWSTATLAAKTVITGVDDGIGAKTIEAIEANPGRVPEARVLIALARALEMDETDFYEWPIAVARRDAKADPDATIRRARDQARKAAQRRRGSPGASPSKRRAAGDEDPDG